MFTKGTIKRYDDKLGFGFIQVNGGHQEVFFHINDFPNKESKPEIGEQLKFLIVEDQGSFKADNIMRLDYMCDLSQSEEHVDQKEYCTSTTPIDTVKLSQRKIIWMLIIGGVSVILVSLLGYQQYQRNQLLKQAKVQQLAEQQKRIIAAQRAALGDLPDEIIVKEKRIHPETATPSSSVSLATTPNVSTQVQKQPVSTQVQKQPVSTQVQSQFSCDGRIHCGQMRSYEEAVFFLRNCPNTQMDGNKDGEPCERQFGRGE